MNGKRTIVLTGCSRGLGRALVEEFIGEGHRVVGCARNADAIADLASRFPLPHRFDVVDVATSGQVDRWAAEVLASHGPPDLLINNAALMNHVAPLWQVPPDEFAALVDVNIRGVFHVCRAFLPAMIERAKGVVVNLSSGWGRSTSAEVAPYCATKFAVEGLTQALAQELPDGMAAVPLNPGIIDTDMLRSCWSDSAGRYPKPARWAKLAAPYLLRLGPADNGQPRTVPDR